MGAWGVAVFSDDLAADLRSEFLELIGDGLSSTNAVERLLAEYAPSLEDDDDAAVFWIALASTQWKMGRLEDRTKREALRVIETGQDLERWDLPGDRKKRKVVLEKVREQLLSPQPAPKRVPRTIREANEWSVGEVIGFRLLSGSWTLMRVIGHHTDKGGRSAVCELLDWAGNELPPAEMITNMSIKCALAPHGHTTQFLFQEPRKKHDIARVLRLGIISTPVQECGGFTVFVWPYVDQYLRTIYGLE